MGELGSLHGAYLQHHIIKKKALEVCNDCFGGDITMLNILQI